MVAVGGDHVVVLAEHADRTDGHRLLAAVLVEEAADLLPSGTSSPPVLRTGGSAASAAASRAPGCGETSGLASVCTCDMSCRLLMDRRPGGRRGHRGIGAANAGGSVTPGSRRFGDHPRSGERLANHGAASLTTWRALRTSVSSQRPRRGGSQTDFDRVILPKRPCLDPGRAGNFRDGGRDSASKDDRPSGQEVESSPRPPAPTGRLGRARSATLPGGTLADGGAPAGSPGRLASRPTATAGARTAGSRRADSSGSPAACRSGPSR